MFVWVFFKLTIAAKSLRQQDSGLKQIWDTKSKDPMTTDSAFLDKSMATREKTYVSLPTALKKAIDL